MYNHPARSYQDAECSSTLSLLDKYKFKKNKKNLRDQYVK